MRSIVIRESQSIDQTAILDVVKRAYSTNVSGAFLTALFHEVTFQAIVLLAALLFIFVGVPLQYCLLSAPIVLVLLYILIYSSLYMKALETVYSKKPLQCWVAEAYEPYFSKDESHNSYRVIHQNGEHSIEDVNFRKTIVGTCAVMKHKLSEDCGWLFRLAVDQRYRRKGIGLTLTQTAQKWCRQHRIDSIELVITECQEEARQIFNTAGFGVKQMYHKKLFLGIFNLQMFQLKCELRPTYR